MVLNPKTIVKKTVRKLGFDIVNAYDPASSFHADHYLRHTARRLEHLASLRIPVSNMTVLDVGAGIGDHSQYYLDRGCSLTITDARAENLQCLKSRFPKCQIQLLDMEQPSPVNGSPFDVVHCYGLLYHLSNPEQALAFLSQCTQKMLFLETCVSFGKEEEINLVAEEQRAYTQANSGTGCRPTRSWLFNCLKKFFKHVYIPKTQPNHEEFPIDWTNPEKNSAGLKRAVFIASQMEIINEILSPSLLDRQVRHE